MTHYQPTQPIQPPHQQQWQPTQPPPASPKPPEWWRKYKHWIMYPVVTILAVAIGSGAANTPTAGDAASSQPTVTATVTTQAQPGQKVTVPGPTKTVPGPVKTVTAPPPAPAGVMADDGIYLVGTDIKPGTYRNGPEGDCYWARLRNTNGDLDSIIANNNGGNQVVTIKRTDKAFETSNCGTWRKVS